MAREHDIWTAVNLRVLERQRDVLSRKMELVGNFHADLSARIAHDNLMAAFESVEAQITRETARVLFLDK